jgi:hypothetical protein
MLSRSTVSAPGVACWPGRQNRLEAAGAAADSGHQGLGLPGIPVDQCRARFAKQGFAELMIHDCSGEQAGEAVHLFPDAHHRGLWGSEYVWMDHSFLHLHFRLADAPGTLVGRLREDRKGKGEDDGGQLESTRAYSMQMQIELGEQVLHWTPFLG